MIQCSYKVKVKVKSLSHVQLFATPWTVAYQAPRSMGFSRQEYWSGLPFPSPGDLPNPGIEPGSPALQTDALPSEPKCSYILYQLLLFSCSVVSALCNFMGCSPPASTALWIFQARILEWVAISFPEGPSQPRDQTRVSCIGRRILYHWATKETQ